MLQEPLFDTLPSKEDFYYDDGWDEKYAIRDYYGKDIDYIVGKCKAGMPLSIMGPFYFVGTKAFRYYVFGAFRYIQEAVENGDKEILFESSCLLSAIVQMIQKHLHQSPHDMQYISAYIKEFSKWVIENYDSFDIDEEGVYGDMKKKWKELIQIIEELYKT